MTVMKLIVARETLLGGLYARLRIFFGLIWFDLVGLAGTWTVSSVTAAQAMVEGLPEAIEGMGPTVIKLDGHRLSVDVVIGHPNGK